MQRTNYKNIKKLALCVIAFEGSEHLYNIISELRDSVDYVSIGLQRYSYHGDPISEIDLHEIFRLRDEDHLVDSIVEIELDLKKAPREQETDKRNILIQDAYDNNCTHCICIDSDEYYTKKAFEKACQEIDEHDYPITYCQYINYYHDYNHFLVYPFKDGMHVPFVTRTEYRHDFECVDFTLPSDPTRRFVRPFDGYKEIKTSDGKVHKLKNYTVDYYVFPWNVVKMHHLSWLRANIRKKLNMWSSKTCFDNYHDLIDKAVNAFNNFDESSENNEALMLFNTPGNKVDVKAFPKQYIHPKVDFNTRLQIVPNYKKIIVLSMSADLSLYNKLEEVSNQTWRNIDKTKFKHCDNIEFWTYTDTDKKTYVDVENHIIYIQKRSLTKEMDGNNVYRTTSKTIEAFNELDKLGIKYDYIIRTNNSTWLNIPLINKFLSFIEDDSLIFGGSMYSCYWSAFNLYLGGNLMIFAKRTIDIIKSLLPDSATIENQVITCDDNLIFGVLNNRLNKLGLKQSLYYHTLGDMLLTGHTVGDIDFSLVAYQVKDYENRLQYDPEKMLEIQNQFNELDISDDNLQEYLDNLIVNYYDKVITLCDKSKEETISQKIDVRMLQPIDRNLVIFKLPDIQKKYGYTQTLI